MVTLRVTRMDLEHLILWARQASDRAKEVGVPFEADEKALVVKLRAACLRHSHEDGNS